MDQHYKGFKQDQAETRAKVLAAKREARAAKNAEGSVTLTNDVFAAKDQVFRTACELARRAGFLATEPTARQAGKYRRGVGAAFAQKAAAEAIVAANTEAEQAVA